MTTRIYAANNIKRLRAASGLSLEETGARMRSELTASTVAKLENRKMALSVDYVLELAEVFGVPPEAVLPGTNVEGVRVVPIVGRIAAGNWQEAIAVSDESIAIPSHLRGANLFALRPAGDSMDRVVKEGGFIVVDPDDRELRDKKFYVIMNGGAEATFKQFCANPMQLLPCSTNPEHKPIPLGSEPFVVVGRVVYAGQEL